MEVRFVHSLEGSLLYHSIEVRVYHRMEVRVGHSMKVRVGHHIEVSHRHLECGKIKRGEREFIFLAPNLRRVMFMNS